MNHSAFIKVDKATFYRFIQRVPDNERYEYVQGRIVQQQAGGTLRHSRVGRRFVELISEQLDRATWDINQERGVETAQTIRFADVTVEPADADPDSIVATAAALIVEVLSPSSGDRDLNEKPAEYLSLPTLQAYVIASQAEPSCMAWVRDARGHWPNEPAVLSAPSEILRVPGLALAIPLSDIYRGLDEPRAPSKDE